MYVDILHDDLNVISEIVNILEDNMGKYLDDLGGRGGII